MSKNKTTETVITDALSAETDKLISEIDNIIDKSVSDIDNISEKDIETLNTDKLNDVLVKTNCVLTMNSCRQYLTDFIRAAELGEDIDKLETYLLSKFDELPETAQLNLLQVLLRKEKFMRKNAEDFKKKIPELLDNLHESKLYYEKRAREKKLSIDNMSPVIQELIKEMKKIKE